MTRNSGPIKARHHRTVCWQNGRGVSLLLLVIAGALLCECRNASFVIEGRLIRFGNDGVFYKGTATEQEAKALGEALKNAGWFKDRAFFVQLAKGPDSTIITYLVKPGTWDDANHVVQYEILTRVVAPAVGGLPVKLRLADEHFTTKKDLTVRPILTVGTKDQISYSDQATEQEAKALGDALKNVGVFRDRGIEVLLSKGQGGTVVSFVVRDGTWDEPDSVAEFERIVRAVGPSVGGLPIKMRLLNTIYEAKKEILIK